MTTIQTDAQRLQALQDESDRRHILAQKMISGGTPTPAAPSGELLPIYLHRIRDSEDEGWHELSAAEYAQCVDADHLELRVLYTGRAAVSQAAPEQATTDDSWIHEEMARDATTAVTSLGRKDLQAAYVGAREDLAIWKRRALEAERALAAPSGAPKQPEPLDFVKALGIATDVFDQYKVDQLKWWKRMDGTPILNDVAVRMAEAFVGAASTVQSAPVLPEMDKLKELESALLMARNPLGDRLTHIDTALNLTYGLIAAQSTPVQVEGQQELEDPILIPRGLVGAACYLIRKHNLNDRLLMKLRSFTFNRPMPSCDSALRPEPGSQHISTGMKMVTLDDPELDANNPVTRFFLLAEYWQKRYKALRAVRHLDADAILKLWRDCGCAVNDGNAIKFARAIESKLASRCRAQGGIDEPNGVVQALALPVAAAPEQKP